MQILFPTGASKRLREGPEEGRYRGDPAVVGPLALPTLRGVIERPGFFPGKQAPRAVINNDSGSN